MAGSNIVTFVTILILIAAAYAYYQSKTGDLVYVTSEVDGQQCLVRDLPDKQQACNMLSKIRQNMMVLTNHLYKEYPDDPAIHRLKQRYDPYKIIETISGDKNTSYTINKGEKMVLCLRARDGHEKLERENTMMFVSLHELAHIMSKSIGHEDDEFWRNFKFILKHAQNLGMYNNVNYQQEPVKYCGMMITDSPLNDASIKLKK